MKSGPPPPLGKHLVKIVREARTRYRKRLAKCRKKHSERAVHALRVETRRVLALFDLVDKLGLNGPSEKVSRHLARRLKTFGPLRDSQVQLQMLDPLWPRFPEARGLKILLERREEKLAAKLAGKIKKMKGSSLNRRLKKIEDALRKADLKKKISATTTDAGSVLGNAFRRVKQLQAQVRPDDAASIHRMRVGFKRFRYLSELLKPLIPAMTATRLKRMKAYQDSAGDIQDLEVLLLRMARSIRDRKLNPAAVRDLRQELLRRKSIVIASFLERIDELDSFRPASGRMRVIEKRG
jgi:CHAD domain-containing protein